VGQLNNKWNPFSLKEYDKFFESFECLKPNSMKSYDGLLLGIAQGENDRPEVAPSASPPKDGLLVIANVCSSVATNICLPSLASWYVAAFCLFPSDGHFFFSLKTYPVEYGHIFLVPSAIHQLSCYWDKRMIGLATKISSEVNNESFKVFFDSGTSVVSGHMIFQVMWQYKLISYH